eukprot:3413484-Rhodomonas_salina.1
MGLVQQTLPRNSGLQQSQSWDLSAPQTRFLSMPTSAGPASALASSTSSEEKARTQRLVWYDKEGRAHYWGWEDEGLPHEGMPASAIQQTRQVPRPSQTQKAAVLLHFVPVRYLYQCVILSELISQFLSVRRVWH